MKHSIRHRTYLCAAIICSIALGLASRKCPGLFPAALGKYPGDALWAQMVYWLVGICMPAASVTKVAVYSLAISYADEISQLYQAPWIIQFRATTLGHLVFGTHFSWHDMAAYTVGVLIVMPIDWWLLRRKKP